MKALLDSSSNLASSSSLLQIGCIVPCSHFLYRSTVLRCTVDKLRGFRAVFDPQIVISPNSSMLSAQPSPVTSPEINELIISPTNGLVSDTTATALSLPSPPVTYIPDVMQPLVQFESQLLAILSDIDATPSPVASPATATQQSVDASPLTERALHYHRRDALRTDRNNVAPVPLASSTDPLDDFGAQMHKKDRLDLTPTPPSEPLHSTIQSKIPSLGPDHYRPTSTRGQLRMPLACNTPATFSRVTQAVHMTEHRSFSACLRCPPRAPSSDVPSRASRRYAMSSSSTSSSAPKATAKGLRPSARGTASPTLIAKPGQPHGTSSPVASSTLLAAPPSPVAPSTLRTISGSGTDRTRGLHPDPLCLRGPLWTTLLDLPPTSGASTKFGTI